ncbi:MULTISPECIES: sensor histidine kinase [Methanobacterium]|jgi:PAS domain S-box-containing protein|uniref:histidine kinase n=1 Tax=Methanobacterium subterraneum TaxID=59277 RepID=A0A2H4VDF3_9EURY|nr:MULTISPECIES: PAS domain S-box protein [Methanobacterium]AUB56133.1 diguanylate cyclase [Methanobacterium subterraneum]AUB58996.1 diguanylate cyclase [Methanobacterium sp. MZ-A1]MBW4257700.1 PAS domain S-box protein [Methanobacterium sp. YSL]NMO08680.1 PAS domain S-box protein [Methanobacterium subterraneum]
MKEQELNQGKIHWELVEMEKELAHTKKRLTETQSELNYLKSIVGHTEDAIVGLDLDGTILTWNPAAKVIYGYTESEVVGSSVSILIPPYNADEISLILAWIKSGERVTHYETLRRRKDGSIVNVSLSVSPIKDSAGKVIGASSIARDITTSKKMELELQESEEKFREVFNNANDAIVLHPIKPDGSPDNFIEVNDVACKRLGYNREELLGMNPRDINNEETIRQIPRRMEKIIRNGNSTFEAVNLTRDGVEIPVEVSAHIFNLRGEKMVLSILRDITRRKESEAQLLQSLNEKELLLKEIHHRVKNNLMVISSLLNLQSKYIKDKAALEVFRESQNRARSMALIHTMLYQSTDLKCINFGDYIAKLTSELFRTYITQDNIDLNLDVGEVLLDINTSIPLGLIVNELVSNSLKHAFPHGEKGEVTVRFHKVNDHFTFQVSDTGIGFPSDLDYQRTNSLGMRLVNTLTDQLDGEIELDTTRGTSFTINFSEEEYGE